MYIFKIFIAVLNNHQRNAIFRFKKIMRSLWIHLKRQAVRIFTGRTKVLYQIEIGNHDPISASAQACDKTCEETLPEPDTKGFDAAKFALEAAWWAKHAAL